MPRQLRLGDYEQEIDRVAERLQARKRLIKDKNSFEVIFNNELNTTEEKLTSKQKGFSNKVFQQFLENNPQVSPKRTTTIKEVKPRTKRRFTISARRGNKVVLARQETVLVKGKPQIRLRDKLGRFVKRI